MTERIATLEELETRWSLDDVLRAMAMLEYRADVEFVTRPKVKP